MQTHFHNQLLLTETPIQIKNPAAKGIDHLITLGTLDLTRSWVRHFSPSSQHLHISPPP